MKISDLCLQENLVSLEHTFAEQFIFFKNTQRKVWQCLRRIEYTNVIVNLGKNFFSINRVLLILDINGEGCLISILNQLLNFVYFTNINTLLAHF